MPLFDNLITKLSQVNLSDINHELGKAKESIVYESGSYLENFKTDASHVGSLIRSESTRFGSFLGAKEKTPALSKSTSLPVIQNLASPDQDCRPCRDRTKFLGSKYKYRSTTEGPEPIVSPQDLLDEESVVNRFIKVVGAEDQKAKETSSGDFGKGRSLSSREDIRKKLASFGEEETICEEEEEYGNNNLEICFINETASDDEEEAVMLNPLAELSDEDSDTNEDFENISPQLPRSKSDWEAFRNPETMKNTIYSEEKSLQSQYKAKRQEEKEKKKIQAAAKVALAQCRQVARRQLALEKQKKSAEDTLTRLLGVGSSELTPQLLANYNVNTLQVILNDFREKIEQHNAELVSLLMQKDELENEQDSMLMDIEDIPHSSIM